ncbi:MAG: riboflavin synthase [Candidatus Calescibacterium sp.]|nr:riboflavin synthase [Candidatus Calescibacterium sp.]MCX7734727.1 riboflavin synthase [bacterium]MDW8087291.1 riboflavin synthase [Candidatus Calescibacterium sp.]
MFSGIVEKVGIVKKIENQGSKIFVGAGFSVKRGESVSVNGACLTVVSSKKGVLEFDLSPETLRRTNLKYCARGSAVNLERSLKLGDRISGHIVQGHILTTLKIISIESSGMFHRFEFEMKDEVKPYIIHKGYVAIDGISLTVSEILEKSFLVDIIPETYRITNLRFRKQNDEVNFEPDIIVKTIVDKIREIVPNLKR